MLSKEDLGNGSKAGLINTDHSSVPFSQYVRDIISHITCDRPRLRRICRNLNRRRLGCVWVSWCAHTREPIPETRSVLIYAKPFISGGTES